jgi:hypothetical protein
MVTLIYAVSEMLAWLFVFAIAFSAILFVLLAGLLVQHGISSALNWFGLHDQMNNEHHGYGQHWLSGAHRSLRPSVLSDRQISAGYVSTTTKV